jgi:hypothetical protein
VPQAKIIGVFIQPNHQGSGKKVRWDGTTHANLVLSAARWLRNTKGCTVVFTEFAATGNETPDAIGFQGERSILVECKVSRPVSRRIRTSPCAGIRRPAWEPNATTWFPPD